MSVAVLIPWAGECPHRAAALDHVRAWYGRHFPDWQICIGEARTGADWCKAEAVRNALVKTSADLLVIADADCFAPRIHEAVNAVTADHLAWAMPHYTVHRLSSQATREVIEDGTDPASFPRNVRHYAQMPYTGYPGGGIVIVRREKYLDCPLDPRFTGWGQEDESWAIALRSLYGPPWRPATGPLWHLWHPPQRRASRAVGSPASQELRTAYRKAAREKSMERHLQPARAFVREAVVSAGL